MQSTASDSVPPSPKRRLSIMRSIGSRLFLSVVGGSLVGLVGTAFLTYWELARQSEAELRSSLQVKAESLNGDFNTLENATKLVADAITTLYEAGERREDVYVKLLDRALATSPLGTGLGFGQPPDKRLILPSRKFAYPYAVRNPKTGTIEAQGGESAQSNFQENYFTQPIAAGRPLWLEPVPYLEDTLNPPQVLVSTSYSMPFYNDKRQLLGVLSQDLELSFLSKKLSVQVMRDAGYFMLVSAKGGLIAYPPDPKLIYPAASKNHDLKQFPGINNYAGLWQRIQSELKTGSSNGVTQWQDADGNREYWAYQRIPNNNWVLMAVVPEAVVLGPVVRFTAIGALGSILGVSIVLGLVVAMFVKRLNQRLQPIMDECNRLAETSAKSETLMSREDELGRLTISFYALLGQVTVNERRLRKEMLKSAQAFHALQQTQAQLIQTEKMSSLGQLVAGVAHEINNPINFIYGNLPHAVNYTKDLLTLVQLYNQKYADLDPEIRAYREDIDLDFLVGDLQKMLESMSMGADRIREIVLSLRNFSRLDEADMKRVNIHDGIDSTLLILQNRLRESPGHAPIDVIKQYGNLPLVECYAGQMNQVFMNILSNAIDALEKYNQGRSEEDAVTHPATITIQTDVLSGQQSAVSGQQSAVSQPDQEQLKISPLETPRVSGMPKAIQNSKLITHNSPPTPIPSSPSPAPAPASILIRIRDNGPGISPEHHARLFDPFFTTKPIGKGTGLGLSISYQIVVEKHRGVLKCLSTPGQGAEFWLEIPVRQQL